MAAIEAFAAQESGDWHVFQQEDGNRYLLGGVWGEPAGSGTWGCKRYSHIEAAGQPLPGAPGAEKVAVFAGSDAVEAFPWTRDHFRAGKPDSNHRTFLVLYRVAAGVPVRVKTGCREVKNGWGKDETAYYGCDPATYHGYVRAVAAYSASHRAVTPEATERAATRVVTPSWGVSKGKGDISALLEAAKTRPHSAD